MSKSANAGELRTVIKVTRQQETRNANGYRTTAETTLIEAAYCKWVNAFGTEALEAYTKNLKELATLTMRYTPIITPDCKIYRGNDREPFEVVSLDNVENKGVWLEIKVKRVVNAQ